MSIINKLMPLCEVPGCTNHAQLTTSLANPKYRKSNWVREEFGVENGYVCGMHHSRKVAEKRGMKNMAHVVAANAGFDSVTDFQNHVAQQKGFANHYEYLKDQAIKAGFRSMTEMQNARHPYRKYRKDYCENRDGRLGFVCTAVFPHEDVLYALGIEYGASPHFDVDHKNGIPTDNRPENLQTLCKCCHSIKGLINQDYKSAGRKTLGVTY